MSLKDLKKARSQITQRMVEKAESKGGNYEADERLWTITKGKDGVGSAKIRFLSVPKVDFDSDPDRASAYVQMFNHGFKVNRTGKWYIENCPTSLEKGDCPVCDMNRELWNLDTKASQNVARDRKRKLSYYSNILVVTDKGNPDNEGKVFIFRYGQKIFDKIHSKLKPKHDDQESIDVFDFWEGADFNLRVENIKADGKTFPNYDESDFDAPSPVVAEGKTQDKQIEAIWEQCHSLLEIVDAEKFKDYDTLKGQLRGALGAEAADYELFGGGVDAVAGLVSDDKEPEPSRTVSADDIPVEEDAEEEDDEAMEYFNDLAEEA